MSRDQILALLSKALPELKAKHGVAELAIFGSVARDEAEPCSDVDVLARYAGPVNLRAYMGLKADLEARLGMPVDLVTPAALKPRLLAAIEPDLLRVS
jgi:predicted nucleotidyltransferase